MPLWLYPALFALFVLASLGSGIWLLLHITAVASVFRSKGDIVPAPVRRRASRAAVLTMLAIFAASTVAVLGLTVLVMTGDANEIVAADYKPVR